MTLSPTTLKRAARQAAKHAATVTAAAALGLALSGCGQADDGGEPPTYRIVRPADAAPVDPHAGHNHGPGEHVDAPPADPHAGHNHGPGEHVDAAPAAPMTPPMQATADLPPPAGSRADFTWTLPEGWQEQPGSAMRMATLAIAGTELDGSVVTLRGDAGGLHLNINRWRHELGLPPVSETAAAASVALVPDAAMPDIVWLAIVAEETQTLAAIIPAGDSTLFVKLRGERAAAAAQESAFLAFVASVHPAAQ